MIPHYDNVSGLILKDAKWMIAQIPRDTTWNLEKLTDATILYSNGCKQRVELQRVRALGQLLSTVRDATPDPLFMRIYGADVHRNQLKILIDC